MSASTIVLATRNAGKVRELAAPLATYGLEVLDLDAFDVPEVEETGETFAANALLKARAVALATGLTAVADDSGLAIAAMSGLPGVHSARYWQPGDVLPGLSDTEAAALPQDERCIRKALHALKDVPWNERKAYFCCTMCAVHPFETCVPLISEGRWHGRILDTIRGAGGFGYDPIFFDEELGLTAAEMPRETKMARSHRGQALAQLLAGWPDFWQHR